MAFLDRAVIMSSFSVSGAFFRKCFKDMGHLPRSMILIGVAVCVISVIMIIASNRFRHRQIENFDFVTVTTQCRDIHQKKGFWTWIPFRWIDMFYTICTEIILAIYWTLF